MRFSETFQKGDRAKFKDVLVAARWPIRVAEELDQSNIQDILLVHNFVSDRGHSSEV